MTVASSTNKITHIGNGSATSFDFPFRIFSDSDLRVILTELATGTETVLESGYSVSGVGDVGGGSVTYPLLGAVLADTHSLTLMRVLPLVQETDIQNQAGYHPRSHEDVFDRGVMIAQQLQEQVSRAVKIPLTSDVDPEDYLTILAGAKRDAESARAAAEAARDAALAAPPFDASLALWAHAAPGAVEQTVGDTLRAGRISITQFSTPQQAATAAAGRTLYIPAGTYEWTAGVTLASGTTVEIEAGATIDMSAAISGTAFYAAGSIATGVALTGDAAKGATSISVAAGAEAGFAAGDWVLVYSDTVYDPEYSAAKFGEVVRVSSTSSGSITLQTPLAGGSYTTAATAGIAKITPVENVTVHGGGLVIGPSDPAVVVTAFRADYGRKIHVEGLRAKNCNGNAVNLRTCWDSVIDRVQCEDALNTSSGYGVNLTAACQDITVSRVVARRCRHAVTNTASGYGVARRLTYRDCTSHDSINTGDAFDTHANAEDVRFDNCVSYDSTANGFNIECTSADLIGCKAFRSTSRGIAVSAGATVEQSRYRLSGCHVDTAGVQGISLQVATGTPASIVTAGVEVEGCTAVNCTNTGITIDGTSGFTYENVRVAGGLYDGASSNGSLYIGDYVKRFVVDGAQVKVNAVASSGLQVRGQYGSVEGNVIQYTVSGATGASSSAAIRIDGAAGQITVDGNVVRQPGSAGGWGVRVLAGSGIKIGKNNYLADCTNPGDASASLTIASGAITLPHGGYMVVSLDTEAAAATDDLDTISGGARGQMITLIQTASTRDPVIKDGTGNLRLAGDFTMTALHDSITLVNIGGVWVEVARADVA